MTVETMLQARRSPLLKDRASAAAARGSWLVAIVLAGLLAATMLLAAPMITDTAWTVPTAISAAVSLLAAQAVRSLTASVSWSSITLYATLLVVILIASAPESPLDVGASVVNRLTEFSEQIGSDLPPLRNTPAVTFIAVVAAQLAVVLIDLCAFTLRRPALALVPLLVYPTLPVVTGQDVAPLPVWFVVAVLVAALLYVSALWARRCEDAARTQLGYTADRRGVGGLSGAAGTTLIAFAITALIGAMLPPASGSWWNAIAPTASLSTNRVNPLIDLGDDLRRDSPVPVLRYATSQTEGELPYLSLVSLSEFTSGDQWSPNEFSGDEPLPGDQPVAPPAGFGADDLAVGAEQSFNVILEPGVTPYLPHITSRDSYAGVDGDYRRDSTSGDVRSADEESLPQSYHLVTRPAQPAPEELATLGASHPEALQPYLELPDDEGLDDVQQAIDDVVTPGASPYQQALELQQWFTGGAFDYSEQAPVSGGYDGTSVDVITRFLEMRSGYCVHFASSMAVMGRMLGIPTRVQVGFTPGTYESTNEIGQSVFSVSSDNLHAWAEFWVPGYGWVPFETTPADGLGEIPAPQETAPEPQPQPTAPESVPPSIPQRPTETPTPTPTSTSAPEDDDSNTAPQPRPRDAGLPEWLPVVLIAVAAAGAVALVLATPRSLRSRQRAARAERVRTQAGGAFVGPDAGLAAAAAAWREVLSTAVDHGMRIGPGTVGDQTAALLAAVRGAEDADTVDLDAAAAALDRLARQRDLAAFSDPRESRGGTPDWDDVTVVSAAIAQSAGVQARRRARRWPASLRERRRREAGEQ